MRRRLPENGSVLIVAMWASIGLVSVALVFGHSMLMTYRAADNGLAARQAEQAIAGAARYAETLLMDATLPGLLPEATTYECDAVPLGEATYWFLGRSRDAGTGLTREFGLVDEASKLNLNTATVDMLRMLPGMTDAFAAAIVDWRDEDDEITTNGAEASSYLTKQPAYECKNGPFESIEELALVYGATRDILYGEDANMNGVLDDNENDGDLTAPADNSDGKLDFGILEYATIFSTEPNKQADGTTARVNLAQPDEALTTLLTNAFGDARARQIQQALTGGQPVRSVLEFYVRGALKEEELAQIIDSVTVGTEETKPGLINVNTASEAVLAVLPGIGTDKASTLVATRLGRVVTDTNIAWVVEPLGAEGATQAGPFLTGQSWQVCADVAAVGRNGHGYRRAKLIVDNSAEKPRILYRRDLGGLGWALGSEIREELAMQKTTR